MILILIVVSLFLNVIIFIYCAVKLKEMNKKVNKSVAVNTLQHEAIASLYKTTMDVVQVIREANAKANDSIQRMVDILKQSAE